MKISDELRRIADALDADAKVGDAGTGHVMQDTGPEWPTWDANGVCADDYWVRGRLGAMKGSLLSDYSIANVMCGQLGAPRDRFCMARPDLLAPGTTGMAAMMSVADAGWINGATYVYDPSRGPADNYHEWMRWGRPSKAPNGLFYDGRGVPYDPAKQGRFSPG